MKANEIHIGSTYTARVSGNFVTVRVDAIREHITRASEPRRLSYDVTNLTTGRKLVFRSAQKFRSLAKPAAPKPSFEQQIRAARERHHGMILLFRMGDFYEAFDADAHTLRDVLGLVVTDRKGSAMCGFPHHALEYSLRTLLGAGKRVAICEPVDTVPVGAAVERHVLPCVAE